MRELAARVRQMAPPLRPVLEELERRGLDERGLAVVAAAVVRDTEWTAARIADPDRHVRGQAPRPADSWPRPMARPAQSAAPAPGSRWRDAALAEVTAQE